MRATTSYAVDMNVRELFDSRLRGHDVVLMKTSVQNGEAACSVQVTHK